MLKVGLVSNSYQSFNLPVPAFHFLWYNNKSELLSCMMYESYSNFTERNEIGKTILLHVSSIW